MALRSLAFAALLLSSCSRAADEQAEVRLDAAGSEELPRDRRVLRSDLDARERGEPGRRD
jgi:hypothetical protein